MQLNLVLASYHIGMSYISGTGSVFILCQFTNT